MKKVFRKTGLVLLAIDSILLSSASVAILIRNPDVTTVTGRHLYAGALANVSLAILLFLLTIFPLRKSEKWAFWTFCIPFPLYGFPMFYLDATHVAKMHWVSTLMPQLAGMLLAFVGLMLIAPSVFRSPSQDS